VELGLQFEPYGQNGWWYEKKLGVARKLIFSKWQEALGGEIEMLVSGSAALQPRLGRVFGAAGMPVMEGYGLTETSPVISVNEQANKGWKIGTTGRVIDRVEVKIAEDGEILCKGPNVMKGYYKDPEKTAEVLKNGVGEGEKMPAALIQPNFEFLQSWAERHKVTVGQNSDIVLNDKVIARIQEEVDLANQDFAKWEKIKQFRLTPDVWSIDDGHLTPTMKLRRKIVKEKYKDLYNDIYGR